MPADMNQYGSTWGPVAFDIDLPSGAKAKVRKIQMEDLVDLGIVEKLDSLGALVQTEHIERVSGSKKPADRQPKKLTKKQVEAKRAQDTANVLKDPARFKVMISVIDRIVVRSIVMPGVTSGYFEAEDGSYKPIPYEDREEGVIYSDSIGLDDKMHIFGAVFEGMEALERFRDRSGEDVGDLELVKEPPV